MRTLKYLNTILTIIALLLTAVLWTLWSHAPMSLAGEAQAQGMVDAGTLRLETLNQIKTLTQKVEELTGLFKNGQARVRLENAADAGAGREGQSTPRPRG